MKIRWIFGKSVCWILLVIACGWAALVLAWASFVNPWLRDPAFAFAVAALACGLVAVGLLVKAGTIGRVSGILQLFVLLAASVLLITAYPAGLNSYRSRKACETTTLDGLRHIRVGIEQYVGDNQRLPPADYWCDEISDYTGDDVFRVGPEMGPRAEPNYTFAFNRSVGSRAMRDLATNTVLIIEAEGPWNNSGGPELTTAGSAKFKYRVIGHPDFLYVLFVDGTMAKYRLRDGAVAKYEGSDDDFSYGAYSKGPDTFGPFVAKGKTPYSPLRWK